MQDLSRGSAACETEDAEPGGRHCREPITEHKEWLFSNIDSPKERVFELWRETPSGNGENTTGNDVAHRDSTRPNQDGSICFSIVTRYLEQGADCEAVV